MAKEAAARPAATIVLMRDGEHSYLGLFWKCSWWCATTPIDFASGALVFPGGRVDENDFALAGNAALCQIRMDFDREHGVSPRRDPRNL